MVLGGWGGSHEWSQGGGGVLSVVLRGWGRSYEWSQGAGRGLVSGPWGDGVGLMSGPTGGRGRDGGGNAFAEGKRTVEEMLSLKKCFR